MNTSDSPQLTALANKLDRISRDVEFLKRRTSSYLGRNEALTYLSDETPIFVNTDDIGCPMNFINGGLYEEDYFAVFRSFCHPTLPMLDIGANLGVYSLRMAKHMRGRSIHAFEPMPRVRSLFQRSAFLNGFNDRITIHPFAVSDHEGSATLQIPADHVGGASLVAKEAEGITVTLRPLDRLFPDSFQCGPVKLDVEGHELEAVRGMRRILERSPEATVMFEKLSPNSGIEQQLEAEFRAADMSIYAIEERSLRPTAASDFCASHGYFIATRASHLAAEGLTRNFFRIFPSDLNIIRGSATSGPLKCDELVASKDIIFHGPYWHLPKGCYKLTLVGDISGAFDLELCENFGSAVHVVNNYQGVSSLDVVIDHDLQNFEIVLRSATEQRVSLSIDSVLIEKIG